MVAITQIIAASTMAFSAVQALPQSQASYTQKSYSPEATYTPTAPATPAASDDALKNLFKDLFTAPTAIKRFQRLLTSGGETLLSGEALKKMIVFPFQPAVPAANSTGGAAKAANIETFPILTGLGISTTVAFLEPCGINTPHVHPRATEFLTLVEGSNLKFGYVLENGLVKPGQNQEIAGALNKFEGTVFPQGSIHFQFNDNCEKATFVAGLNSEDSGTSQIAQNFFSLNAGVVRATLGFPKTIDASNFDEFRKAIPANLAQDIEVCLARCKKN